MFGEKSILIKPDSLLCTIPSNAMAIRMSLLASANSPSGAKILEHAAVPTEVAKRIPNLVCFPIAAGPVR